MTGSMNAYSTDYRTVTIRTMDGSTIQGLVNILPDQRVSDLLTRHQTPFIVVVQASYMDAKGKTLFINKRHILWIEPEESEIEH